MLHPIALFVSAGLALWVAALVQRRPASRHMGTFVWLVVATAWWCTAGAFHSLAPTLPLKLTWAKIQYVGIASVPPLWLLFTAEYAGVSWFKTRARFAALWLLPVLTLVMAATNDAHRLLWPWVEMRADGLTRYGHGPFFWLAASASYVMVATGALLVARQLRRSPPPFRAQQFALLAGAFFPLAGNLIYISGRSVQGLDLTPLAFVCSSLLFTWALFRHHLFDLVPVARDMVIDSLSDAVFVLDPSRRVLDLNAAAREMVGESAHWLGRRIDALLPLLRGQPIEFTSRSSTTLTVDAAGTTMFYDLRLMPVHSRNGALAAWVLLLRDITDQRRAAEERNALANRIQEQQRRESLSVLAGGLAHDFNNLLTGIVGNADLLSLKLEPSSEMGGNVGAILLGAQRAADLVDKMLAYAGERHGSLSRVDLDDLIRDLLDLLQASAARHCTLHYEGTPAFIDADATQLRQVAMNLIINAAEAVDENAGEVRVRIGIERLSKRQLAEMDAAPDATPGTFACLEVRDNGHGMDAETAQKIFDPFFTTKATGHGLGLAAVQGIVRGHRGALKVDSAPGAGAKFCCWFPLADDDKTRGTATGRPEVSREEEVSA